ncbi:HipA domain-containing protein [Persicobacter diffluens]|uniref:HipA-like C-terminal domain-containing protein n=1 Tax=Persicobacter diffluens TaxID=981 RepID=A0AAN4W5J3_9BACT|nr:hypothetical protein PEDI_52790 [Persicobacter diffluens]
MSNCLLCYKPLKVGEVDYHPRCVKTFYQQKEVPELDFTIEELDDLAQQVVNEHITITGVQPKLSLAITSSEDIEAKDRFTIVGLWGNYILKPPFETYPQLPENEDLTMHLARLFKIPTVPHGLIRMKSGELAYICKRVDRTTGGMIHMEDFCQLSERLTEDKYKGSIEQLAQVIQAFSSRSGYDLLSFFELTVFCFLTGNADMHRKNFSLLYSNKEMQLLAPAYDLVNTKLAMPQDLEEMALMLNGKKRKLKKSDFEMFGLKIGLKEKQIVNTFKRFSKLATKAEEFVAESFLDEEKKGQYLEIMQERFKRLGLT